MQNISWQYLGVVVKPVQIDSVDTEFREAAAVDLEVALPLIIDIPNDYQISSVQAGKSYLAVMKVYKTHTILKSRIASNGTLLTSSPLKFELIGLKPNP